MQSWFWQKYLVSDNKQEWLDAWIKKGRKWHYMTFFTDQGFVIQSHSSCETDIWSRNMHDYNE